MMSADRTAATSSHEVGRRSLFLGTFLISAALLSFELTSVRTINFTVGPGYIYHSIALAMLGLSSAGSILSLIDVNRGRHSRERILFWACIAIAGLIVLSHFMTVETKSALNDAAARAGHAEGLIGIVRALGEQSLKGALWIGLALSLPYFLFGGLLAFLFATSEGRIYGRLYAADLIGAALGCIGVIVVMEAADYALSVTAPAIVAALAAAAFAAPRNRPLALGGLLATACLLIASATPWYRKAIEPPADSNYLVRDYRYESTVHETWRGWNSFTRVGLVEWTDGSQPYAVLSLANGDGMAWLFPYESQRGQPVRHPPTVPALLLDPPKDALVLFAGAGADLMTLHEHGAGRVVGVELNGMLVRGALGLTSYRLTELLDNPSVVLKVAEGRVFLERDSHRYDMIFMSWSGTTAAYYAGMLGPTTQYLYTYEGLAAILDHLKPGGYAIVLQVNKVKLLAGLRRYLAARGIANAERTAVVLFDPDDPARRWDGVWDNNTLLIKPDGWADAEIAQLRRGAAGEGWKVAYAPGLPVDPEYTVYPRILRAPDVEAELAALQSKTQRRFSIPTDDRPFFLDLFPNERYLSRNFWLGPFTGKPLAPYESYRLVQLILVAVITLLAGMLILVPLGLRAGPRLTRQTLSHLAYFFCLGTGFMVLEIALMQKASLLFGNPGLTIAIVLASVILFSGIGSLMSDWSLRQGLAIRTLAIGVFGYALALYFILDGLLHFVLGWPLVLKGAFLAAIIAPLGLLMGHMFPQGLVIARQHSAALIPWAWGINGAMSTVIAGLAPLLAQGWGFDVLILVGACTYAAVVPLPTTRQRAQPSEGNRLAWPKNAPSAASPLLALLRHRVTGKR